MNLKGVFVLFRNIGIVADARLEIYVLIRVL